MVTNPGDRLGSLPNRSAGLQNYQPPRYLPPPPHRRRTNLSLARGFRTPAIGWARCPTDRRGSEPPPLFFCIFMFPFVLLVCSFVLLAFCFWGCHWGSEPRRSLGRRAQAIAEVDAQSQDRGRIEFCLGRPRGSTEAALGYASVLPRSTSRVDRGRAEFCLGRP